MTMYSNKLAVAIKTAGKVLREQGDKVFLPFGSEYSIFVKNLNTVRALVRISLDGVSVTDGEDLVVQGNSEINLERFLKKSNYNEGHKFKFIERSGKIEAHRGIGVEDGLLRVEFQFEKVIEQPKIVNHDIHHYNHHYWPKPYYCWPYPYNGHPYYYGSLGATSFTNTSTSSLMSSGVADNSAGVSAQCFNVNTAAPIGGSADGAVASAVTSASVNTLRSIPLAPPIAFDVSRSVKSASVAAEPVNDAGITVPGSISNQQFTQAAWFPVETETHVIVLKLVGDTGQGLVEQPLTVQKKQTCPTCGTRNRGSNKCCRECGTSLEIVGSSPRRRSVGVRG
jgi:hypothetical protein